MKYYAVIRERGSAWDESLSMRQQVEWKDHASFMDNLAEEGLVTMGGPLGNDEKRFLLIFNANSREGIERMLAQDPWTVK